MNNQPTKLFFDCEFTGLYANADLISIGIVGPFQSFYAEFTDFDITKEDSNNEAWITSNVIPNLILQNKITFAVDGWEHINYLGNSKDYSINCIGSKGYVKYRLINWLNQFDKVEFYGDVLMYDWVLLCNLFGGAFNMPKNVLYIPIDISTLLRVNSIDIDTNREELAQKNATFQHFEIKKHNAFSDAIITKLIYETLVIK